MTAQRILFLSLVFSFTPGLAFGAGRPSSEKGASPTRGPVARASPDPATLGKVEGILDYCAKLSGRAPSRDRVGAMMGRASEKELGEVRNSPDYKASYEEVSAALVGVPKDKAQEACGAMSN